MTRPEHRIDPSKPHLVTTPAPSATAVPRRVMVIYGTRPEAVKVAPLIRALDQSPLSTALPAVTAQHRSMLDLIDALLWAVARRLDYGDPETCDRAGLPVLAGGATRELVPFETIWS